jgi:hypothetical protein
MEAFVFQKPNRDLDVRPAAFVSGGEKAVRQAQPVVPAFLT